MLFGYLMARFIVYEILNAFKLLLIRPLLIRSPQSHQYFPPDSYASYTYSIETY
jgi:hypothetical protein